MKARTLTRVLGVILPAALVITSPVFAHDPDYDGRHVDHDYSYGGHVDHDYSYGGHVDHEYGTSWYGNRDYYDGYQGRGYARSPDHGDSYYYGGYGHPSGFLGYWGKDARHHARGHYHHHWF